jgi:hypothetical protein
MGAVCFELERFRQASLPQDGIRGMPTWYADRNWKIASRNRAEPDFMAAFALPG